MIRAFHLDEDETELNILINDTRVRPKHIRVNCDRKTSTTIVFVDYIELKDPRNQKRKRRIRRFHLLNGEDEALNHITDSNEFRIVQRYDFLTENGVVVVLDYEDRRV